MEDKVSILIVEDEGIVALGLEDTLETEGYHVTGIADNGREALDLVKSHPVDLVLLDIQIKGDWDGITTARHLSEAKEIPFIFLTAFSDAETLNRAKGTAPAAYLVKPYQPRNLLVAIDLALHNFAYRKTQPSRVVSLFPKSGSQGSPEDASQKEDLLYFNDAVFIKQRFKFMKVRFDDILYLEVEGNYTHLIARDHKYVIRNTLNGILDRLDQAQLVRVHRSFAINIRHLETFNDISVFVGTHEIPLGRHYKEHFFRHFDFL